MPKYGLLINYEYCIGCHVCEIACKQENNRPLDEWGIYVMEVKPDISNGKMYYFPFPTDNCNLCGKRIAKGLLPACVKHCQTGIMKFGKIEELTEYMQHNKKTLLWVPR